MGQLTFAGVGLLCCQAALVAEQERCQALSKEVSEKASGLENAFSQLTEKSSEVAKLQQRLDTLQQTQEALSSDVSSGSQQVAKLQVGALLK